MPTNVTRSDLAGLRSSKGISLSKIAQDTKIPIRYLEAIELGHFAKLPGGHYDVSYIRQYSQAFQYDENKLLAQYRGSLKTNPAIDERPSPVPYTGATTFRWFSPARWFDMRALRNVGTRMLRKI
jgi:transcriptional regulator with XRE-family HTH domain